MNAEIQTVTLVLTGPLKGKTVQLNGRWFHKGRCQINAPANVIGGALHYYGTYYQAYPEGSAKLLEAQSKEVPSAQCDLQTGPVSLVGDSAVHGGVQPSGEGAGPEASALGSVDAAPAPGSDNVVAPGDGQASTATAGGDQVAKIREALGKLDPENAEHWNEEGEPRVDVVTNLAGFPVTRAEINAITGGAKNPKAKKKPEKPKK